MAQPFVEPCSRGIIAAEPCPRELGREIAPRRRKMVLAACVLASSMAFIDGSALTVALPKLRAHFGADLASVQWVLNGYLLALAALSLIGGALADWYGKARVLAIGCLLFALAYGWLALGHHVALAFGVLGPMALLGIAFAMLVAPLTASVLSSVESADEGLASGINNAISRIAQLIGVALAAGVATFAIGYELCLAAAALLALAAATNAAVTVPAATEKSGAS